MTAPKTSDVQSPAPSQRSIRLRGVRVHNLQSVDLDLPRHQLIVFCGLSGSGKTSLALDTLYAEGQRRYIESFSAYTRQFLERLEKPAADQIEGIPAAIAVTHKNNSRSNRSTIGTATEIGDYLRLMLARVGMLVCRQCGHAVSADTPHTVARWLASLPPGTRYQLGFPFAASGQSVHDSLETLRARGYVRAIHAHRMLNLEEPNLPPEVVATKPTESPMLVISDRLVAGQSPPQRVEDSLESAFREGAGRAVVLASENLEDEQIKLGKSYEVDGQRWWKLSFSEDLTCERCNVAYSKPEPKLFSFNSPIGACPECQGFGNIVDVDMDLVVPDSSKTLADGALAPWNTPAYAHELQSLLAAADALDLPTDVPYRELSQDHKELLQEGAPEHGFGGLRAFFDGLERRKYKMHLRVFLSRWRSHHSCPECQGTRLRDEALAWQLGGHNMAELCRLKIDELAEFMAHVELSDQAREVARVMLDQIQTRLAYLQLVGLGYLTLDRTLRTLSGGEAQRVALTSALGSSLVNLLYVLDEPSVGLHPQDITRLVNAISGLRSRRNTVIVVEHEEAFIRAADEVVEVGPGAGERGGRVVFQGTPQALVEHPDSLTAAFLAGRRGGSLPAQRRPPEHGSIRLTGATGNNLQQLSVEFPLGLLCLVTGVSGSGKSTLIEDTLYPALMRRLRKEGPKPLPHDDIFGDGQIEDVILVDQNPIGRSARSNPVTYIKAFDAIRDVFAETVDARTRNFSASHFSFNVDGGRCEACKGEGYTTVDMQFLADVNMKCSECQGQRYRRQILSVKYRGRNISDVLEMTVREAYTFFRGHTKVQRRLQRLIDVGLDYLRLGQPANTLSCGESQRLKLAAYLSQSRRNRTLFVLDEPTTGLHFADVVQLLDCFDALLAVGHSLIVVEHNLQIMRAADYIVDLGPGAAEQGGQVIAVGTPEEIASHPKSITGKFLASALANGTTASRVG